MEIHSFHDLNELLAPDNAVRVTPAVPLGEIEITREKRGSLYALIDLLLENKYDVFISTDNEGATIVSYSFADPSHGAPQHLWCDPA